MSPQIERSIRPTIILMFFYSLSFFGMIFMCATGNDWKDIIKWIF